MIRVTKSETVDWGDILGFCTALLIKIDSIVFPLDLPGSACHMEQSLKKTIVNNAGSL